MATYYSHMDVMNLLLDAGANINAVLVSFLVNFIFLCKLSKLSNFPPQPQIHVLFVEIRKSDCNA